MTDKDKLGVLRITNMTDREDGGANIEVDMDENTAVTLARIGLEITLYCAAYNVDPQDVLDWISSHELGDENG